MGPLTPKPVPGLTGAIVMDGIGVLSTDVVVNATRSPVAFSRYPTVVQFPADAVQVTP